MDLTSVLSSIVGWLVVAGSVGLKVPQIIAILKERSAEGVNIQMFYTEVIMYTISIAYNVIDLRSPFSNYGDLCSLLVQDFVIIFLLFLFDSKSNPLSVGFSALVAYSLFSSFLVFVPFQLTESTSFLEGLMQLVILLNVYSRLPQIFQNLNSKSTGSLSFLTFSLNSLGALARVFTTVVETGDMTATLGYVVSAVLNGIIAGQIVVYGNRKKKV